MNALKKLDNYISSFFPGKIDYEKIIGHKTKEIECAYSSENKCNKYDKQDMRYIQPVEMQAVARLRSTEIIKQKNLNDVINEAKRVIGEDNQADERDIGTDWLLKFMDIAGNISDDTLQKMWGKILARKVEDTSKISLLSLVTISNLSLEVAQLFEEMSKYVVNVNGSNILLNDIKFNEKYGIYYYNLLRLDEYGLINSNGMISMNVDLSNVANWHINYGEFHSLGCSTEKTKLNLQVFTLREAGDDLLSIMHIVYDEKYFNDFKRAIAKENKAVKFIDVK